MSFNPLRDGHMIWNFIHLMAANAVTPAKRELYIQTINGFKISFPCEICRLHLITNLEELPVEPYSNTNVSLFYHSWKLHDTVNAQLNKPSQQRLTYEQAFAKWFPSQSPTPTTTAPEPERPLVSAGNSNMAPSTCSTCGTNKVQNSKPNFTEFRKQQKKSFLSKNN